jgi:ketosteroid isomerase-like protein
MNSQNNTLELKKLESYVANLDLEKVQDFLPNKVKGIPDLLKKWVSPDVVWAVTGSIDYPLAGWYYGLDQVLQAFQAAALITESNGYEWEVRNFIVQDNQMVVFGYESGLNKPSGLPFENNWAYLMIWQDGKVVEFREYFTFPESKSNC